MADDKAFQSKAEDKKDVGPLKDRSCTDVVCILMFIVFLAGMGVLTWYAFNWGDPYRITNGYDSFGNVCGRNNAAHKRENVSLSGRDMTDFPYLMYFDPTQMVPSAVDISALTSTDPSDPSSFTNSEPPQSIETTMMICVKECPKESIVINMMSSFQKYYQKYNQSLCQYDYLETLLETNNFTSVTQADYSDCVVSTNCNKYIQTGRGPCPSFVFQSEPVLSRCIPLTDLAVDGVTSEATEALAKFDTLVNNNFGDGNYSTSEMMQYAMSDVMNSYREIIVMCAASMIISFIIILLLGWIAQIMIWGIAIASAVACVAGPAYFWYTWYKAKEAYDALSSGEQLASVKENITTLMYYAIIITVICVVVLLLILFLRSRVGLMVSLFKEAGFMVMRMITILFTPIVLAVFIVAWAAIWVFVSSYIYTAGMETEYTIVRTTEAGNVTTMFYTDRPYTELAWLYHLFGLYWGTEFLLACHEMALAGAFVQFYWTRDKRNVSFPVLRGIWWVFRYHLGTVAFGSCIIAIIQLVRTILAYIQNKTKNSASEIVKYLLMCLQCCLWCFEKVMKFINRNAYIYTAFKGSAFCSSCKKVFGLLMANLVRVAIINCVGAFILFMGKFFVVIITGILGYFMMQRDETLNYWAIPVLIAAIFSLAVAYCFFSVYEIGIDTIFICFAEDSTINDGTPGREYYMSKNLMAWVENSNEAMKNLRRKKKQQKQKPAAAEVEQKKDKKGVYPSLEGEMAMEDIS